MKNKLSEELYIKELLKHVEVNAQAGVVYWTNPSCSRIQIGSILGGKAPKNGYYRTNFSIDNVPRTLAIHRVIYYSVHGYLPFIVDHVDRDSLNNQISNLRSATRSQDQANRKVDKRSTSGVTGVSFNETRGKWYARISANKANHFLGVFDSKCSAVKARKEAAIKYHGEYASLP